MIYFFKYLYFFKKNFLIHLKDIKKKKLEPKYNFFFLIFYFPKKEYLKTINDKLFFFFAIFLQNLIIF